MCFISLSIGKTPLTSVQENIIIINKLLSMDFQLKQRNFTIVQMHDVEHVHIILYYDMGM